MCYKEALLPAPILDPQHRLGVKEGGLELLSSPPVTRFTVAFVFHLLDALFYILTPPDLLFADIWKVVPFKGMTAVHSCLIALEVAKGKSQAQAAMEIQKQIHQGRKE